jgi:hypothetical protein
LIFVRELVDANARLDERGAQSPGDPGAVWRER